MALEQKLTLNLFKTTFMIVSSRNTKLGWPTDFEVKFSGYSLTKSQQTKYLGIFVDENLKWDAHIKYICNKLSHISGIFYKMRRLISQDALIVLYYGLVQSHLTYGLLAWGSANKTNIQSLQVLLNKIIRTLSGVRRNEHVANNILCTNLKILKIEKLYFLEIAKFMYLYHHNKLPELFFPYINVTKNIHPHVSRRTTQKNSFVPHVNSNSAKKSLLFMGTKIGNGFRLEWKEYSYNKFKKAVKNHLLLKYS